MRPTRGPPQNGEGRNTRQGMRPSVIGFPAPDNLDHSTNNRRWESAMFASLALDLLADTRRERNGALS